ncbi:GFA family protein [Colwelliaceae bacterium 6441]
MMKNQASCLCGKISIVVDEFLPVIGHCHCTMCRKFHGAAFSTFVEVEVNKIHFLSGEDYISCYQAENETVRKFCRCCGSSLLFESNYNRQANTLEIALAAFDTHVPVSPDAHIYVESKVEWLTINDDLAHYLAYRE